MLENEGFSNTEALYPLQIIQADNFELPIEIQDGNGNIVNGYPELTLGGDLFSRLPWAKELSMDKPSAAKIKRFLEHGLLPKNYLRNTQQPEDISTVGTIKEWVAYGVPTMFVFDNGSDFAAKETKRVVEEVLKCEVHYCPPGQPETKGFIENFGKKIQAFVRTLPGGLKKGRQQRKIPIKAENLLTLEELDRHITRYLVDIYPYQNHRGLPAETPTPIQKYVEGLKVCGPPYMMTPEEVTEALFGLLPEYYKGVTKYGLRFHNITYRSSEIQPYVRDNRKYKVKWDPDDVSHCFLLDDKAERWIEVKSVKPSYEVIAGVNKYRWDKIVAKNKLLRKEKLAELDDASIIQAKIQIKKECSKSLSNNKKLAKEAMRMKRKGLEKSYPPNVAVKESKSVLDELDELALEG